MMHGTINIIYIYIYIYIYIGEEVETSPHILCECEALPSLRQTNLDSFFLDLEDIKSLNLGVIWNFSKGTALP